jgi:hypothetical protein
MPQCVLLRSLRLPQRVLLKIQAVWDVVQAIVRAISKDFSASIVRVKHAKNSDYLTLENKYTTFLISI